MNHILVVDDDPGIRRMVTLTLQTEGYEVATATNGVEALDEIRQAPPSAMLLDMQMPVLDGWGVVLRLREQGCWVPTVVMTATQPAEAWYRKLGADACLSKRFSIHDLLEVVERLHAR